MYRAPCHHPRPNRGASAATLSAPTCKRSDYELQVVAAGQYGEVLVDQLLELLGEGPHGAALDGEAAMVTPEAILSY
jgi:hypothetical protein